MGKENKQIMAWIGIGFALGFIFWMFVFVWVVLDGGYEQAFTVTAYCPCSVCCGRYADGVTASGHKIEEGEKLVAAPKDIPFGTIMVIPEYGTAEVQDRGGSIAGDRLDVLFDTHAEALRWGKKRLMVKVKFN